MTLSAHGKALLVEPTVRFKRIMRIKIKEKKENIYLKCISYLQGKHTEEFVGREYLEDFDSEVGGTIPLLTGRHWVSKRIS